MRRAFLVVLMLGLASSAGADVYFEIVGHGMKPIGNDNGGFPFYYTGDFDVYAWGSGSDTSLHHADFDIVFQDIYGGAEIQLYGLGTVDPLNRFNSLPQSAGTIMWDRIENVQMTSSSSVALPQTHSQALLLYEDFSLYFDGMLRVVPRAISTNAGTDPVIHSYGVFTTPEPMTVLILGGGTVLLGIRRPRRKACC